MKLTKKKAEIVVGAAIRDVHILITAANLYKSVFADPKTKQVARGILGDDGLKSIKEMYSKIAHIDKILTTLYSEDKDGAKFLKSVNGLTHIEEIAAKIGDASIQIQKEYSPNEPDKQINIIV